MRVCARVCARRVCVKSHPFQLPGSWAERGEREQEYWSGARGAGSLGIWAAKVL